MMVMQIVISLLLVMEIFAGAKNCAVYGTYPGYQQCGFVSPREFNTAFWSLGT